MCLQYYVYTYGALTFPIEALAKVGGFLVHLGVESAIFMFDFYIKEQEFVFTAYFTCKVEGGVGNAGIPQGLEVLLAEVDIRLYYRAYMNTKYKESDRLSKELPWRKEVGSSRQLITGTTRNKTQPPHEEPSQTHGGPFETAHGGIPLLMHNPRMAC